MQPKSIFDVKADEVWEARLDAKAEADYRAGRVVSHQRVTIWLAKLVKGERHLPPSA